LRSLQGCAFANPIAKERRRFSFAKHDGEQMFVAIRPRTSECGTPFGLLPGSGTVARTHENKKPARGVYGAIQLLFPPLSGSQILIIDPRFDSLALQSPGQFPSPRLRVMSIRDEHTRSAGHSVIIAQTTHLRWRLPSRESNPAPEAGYFGVPYPLASARRAAISSGA
jgi:hypothetical protein